VPFMPTRHSLEARKSQTLPGAWAFSLSRSMPYRTTLEPHSGGEHLRSSERVSGWWKKFAPFLLDYFSMLIYSDFHMT
jgi:hypothetical protein